MTRVLLIEAGPTPWDAEDRLVGSQTLPLTPEAAASIQQVVDQIQPPIDAIYRCASNEATDQVAKMLAKRFSLRPRHRADLEELHLGLWQGLKRAEAQFRFPSVLEQWEQNPASVKPPDGETLDDACARLRGALRKILRRNRGRNLALSLRPMAMQIVLGLLELENLDAIAAHLHNRQPLATIELPDEKFDRVNS